jgi:glucose-1-phosphate cytidylyltransferase
MKTVILAGGLGTRLAEETDLKPKPMVEIGHEPILWHIMQRYACFGFTEFVVALGYRGDVIKDYFLGLHYKQNDVTIDLGKGRTEIHDGARLSWVVHLVDTGLQTQTFMMTYGDGVADVDVEALVRFHKSHGKLATVTAVRPPARFGGLSFDGDLIIEFLEKPQIGEGWINGGFFVLEPGVLDYIDGDETIWEREPLERLAEEGELVAFRHDGFWQPMDTLRDVRLLESLWESGDVPWKVWE